MGKSAFETALGSLRRAAESCRGLLRRAARDGLVDAIRRTSGRDCVRAGRISSFAGGGKPNAAADTNMRDTDSWRIVDIYNNMSKRGFPRPAAFCDLDLFLISQNLTFQTLPKRNADAEQLSAQLRYGIAPRGCLISPPRPTAIARIDRRRRRQPRAVRGAAPTVGDRRLDRE